MTVTNKKQMYWLFAAGAFGNRPQTWSKLSDLLASRFTGEVGMFLRDPRGGGGRVDYNVPVAIAAERTEDWIRHGIPPARFSTLRWRHTISTLFKARFSASPLAPGAPKRVAGRWPTTLRLV